MLQCEQRKQALIRALRSAACPGFPSVRFRTPVLLFGTQKVNPSGHLQIGGCDAVDLVREFGTPLYVLDEVYMRERMQDYRRAFGSRYPNVVIAYAGKAFLTLAMARIVAQEGLHLDVASAGELYTALKADFPPHRLVLHGNNKSDQEITMALQHGVGRIVVDNLWELDRIMQLARARGVRPNLQVRSNPGVDPSTHRLIRTGQEDSKFGLNIRDGSAMEAVQRIVDAPEVEFSGIHCHVGSQLMNSEAHQEAVEVMCAFMARIENQTGASVEELNLGGGLGIRYLEEQEPDSVDVFAESLINVLTKALDRHDLGRPVLGQEPGRSIVGQAGVTLYTVGPVKRVAIPEEPGYRRYVTIDGGMSDNPRPQLYDAVYEAYLANKADRPRNQKVRVAGKHCETDILIQETELQEAEPGDILAVPSTGAYNHSMASNYNRIPRPAVVMVRGGAAEVIVKRETLDDLLRQDVMPERLRRHDT